MGTIVLSRKMRRNVDRRPAMKRAARRSEVAEGVAVGLGRTFVVLVRWLLGISVIIAVSFGILSAYRWVTHHEFFALDKLQVTGGQRLSPETIAALGGVQQGQNVIGINIAEVQRRIASCEWVESVSVTRILPDELIIDVKEREPEFLVRRDDQLFYADGTGQPIVAVGVSQFTSLPMLDKEDGIPLAPGIGNLMNDIANNALPFGMNQLAWVRQDSVNQFSLYLENPRILIQLDGTDLQGTLSALSRLWSDLEHRGELYRAEFMFVTPGRAWIRLLPEQEN